MTFSDIRKKTSASNSNKVSLQAVGNQFAHMREPPSPDERCPSPPTQAIAMGACQWRWDNEKDEQSCSGWELEKEVLPA